MAEHAFHRTIHRRRRSPEWFGAPMGRRHILAISYKVRYKLIYVKLRLSSVRTTLRGLSKASLFFLDILSRHPSEDLQRLSKDLMPLIDSQPRLQNFPGERDFAY